MPLAFSCDNCQVTFVLGPESHRGDRYSSHYLVCTGCATQHRLDRAYRPQPFEVRITALPEERRTAVTDALMQRYSFLPKAGPLIAADLLDGSPYSAEEEDARAYVAQMEALGAQVKLIDRRPTLKPPSPDRLWAASGPAVGMAPSAEDGPGGLIPELVLRRQMEGDGMSTASCMHCPAVGTLIGNARKLSCCPHCGGPPPKDAGGWVT